MRIVAITLSSIYNDHKNILHDRIKHLHYGSALHAVYLHQKKCLLILCLFPFSFVRLKRFPQRQKLLVITTDRGKCVRMHKNQMAAIMIRFNENRLERQAPRAVRECDQITN